MRIAREVWEERQEEEGEVNAPTCYNEVMQASQRGRGGTGGHVEG